MTMGYSLQRFFVAADDTLYRLATTAFDRMLHDPSQHRLPAFAGQRVRSVEVVVELANREPVAVVRRSFSVLTFDSAGRLNAARHLEQQFARAETALAPVFASSDRDAKVVSAASRFIAQGGAWTPSAALQRAIDDTALGQRTCQRLTPVSGGSDSDRNGAAR